MIDNVITVSVTTVKLVNELALAVRRGERIGWGRRWETME